MTPDEPLPPYAYVPGGPWPHPVSDPAGHLAGRPREAARPVVDDRWAESAPYLRGVCLFNAGYYWEAHEAWEALWHAHGRRGPTADVLKALIKLAAAGVKVRQGQPNGVTTHARRAAALLEATRDAGHERLLGLDLGEWAAFCRSVAEAPTAGTEPTGARVVRVFERSLAPTHDGE